MLSNLAGISQRFFRPHAVAEVGDAGSMQASSSRRFPPRSGEAPSSPWVPVERDLDRETDTERGGRGESRPDPANPSRELEGEEMGRRRWTRAASSDANRSSGNIHADREHELERALPQGRPAAAQRRVALRLGQPRGHLRGWVPHREERGQGRLALQIRRGGGHGGFPLLRGRRRKVGDDLESGEGGGEGRRYALGVGILGTRWWIGSKERRGWAAAGGWGEMS